MAKQLFWDHLSSDKWMNGPLLVQITFFSPNLRWYGPIQSEFYYGRKEFNCSYDIV